jgi:hypothetical protein
MFPALRLRPPSLHEHLLFDLRPRRLKLLCGVAAGNPEAVLTLPIRFESCLGFGLALLLYLTAALLGLGLASPPGLLRAPPRRLNRPTCLFFARGVYLLNAPHGLFDMALMLCPLVWGQIAHLLLLSITHN